MKNSTRIMLWVAICLLVLTPFLCYRLAHLGKSVTRIEAASNEPDKLSTPFVTTGKVVRTGLSPVAYYVDYAEVTSPISDKGITDQVQYSTLETPKVGSTVIVLNQDAHFTDGTTLSSLVFSKTIISKKQAEELLATHKAVINKNARYQPELVQ